MPHFLQGSKITYRGSGITYRMLTAKIRRGDMKMSLKARLDEVRWANPRRREFLRKRVFPGYYT